MKSGKQRRSEIIAERARRNVKRAAPAKAGESGGGASGSVPVNEAMLAPCNSYGVPEFAQRGYYIDLPFRCIDCGKEEIWTAAQQKWWYEIAKGFVYSTAVRCRLCRRRKRSRHEEARRVHLAGIAGKKSRRSHSGEA